MNIYYLLAGVLCIILGVVHSVLGEYLIFRHKRVRGHLVPTQGSSILKERHLRIIWATWHLASVLGWGLAALLIKIALDFHQIDEALMQYIVEAIMYTLGAGALVVLIGTKGKHPGWMILLLILVLLLIGNIL